ncbi:serine/threonine protein kinase [Terribacillus halophilus]|uniref:serine/threonine protein kinase n=1 Tax=Terribacillus halophilus TaxID=361279 RepID=UPI000985D57D|nr:serine/threonine protein kinase [Terribacillus halophilus]
MTDFKQVAEQIQMTGPDSMPNLKAYPSALELIGTGRSAFAFRILESSLVIKVFFPAFQHIAAEEAAIYQTLAASRFFPDLYDAGQNYLVMDYIPGHTLYDCLRKGIPIRDHHIVEIEHALRFAAAQGLNPSDIHLRNILITPTGDVRLIDPARFRQQKQCTQWKDLHVAYEKLYKKKVFPKKIPSFLLELIAYLYKKRKSFTFQAPPNKAIR